MKNGQLSNLGGEHGMVPLWKVDGMYESDLKCYFVN